MDDSVMIMKGEEALIRILLKHQHVEGYENKKISTLCHKDEVKGEYKNEFFNYIHIDEDGRVIDAYMVKGEPDHYEISQNRNILLEEFSREVMTFLFLI